MSQLALVRPPSPRLAEGLLTHMERTPVDVALAVRQWEDYVETLRARGWETVEVPAAPDCPDSAFVEDTMVVFRDVAVLARPGADERKPEVAAAAAAVAALGYRCVAVEAPGTLDGGDILRIGRDIYVGASARSNDTAVAQLRKALLGYGYRVHQVVIQGCLHLKSAVTQISDDTLLVQPQWLVDAKVFAGYRRIEVDPAEGHAANALRIGRSVVYPSCFPRTQARIESIGVEVRAVDVSELQKAEGAVTCCSVLFRA